MSTSTSTSARRTGTDGTRRTTVRPRCQARARATRSGNDAPAMGTGGSAVGLSAASRATVVIPAARSAVAASPRTTRLTSCSRASSASQVGHHGQRRHSMTRDGRASAGAPVAAAVATATRSAKRASYSASVLRWPGQCSAARSCQTTTSASSPTTPPCRPKGSPGGGAQPASSSIRCRWARRIRSRVWVRDLRAGSAAACRGSVSGRGEVRAPLPASVTRCRTTITGTYPPPGRRTSSSRATPSSPARQPRQDGRRIRGRARWARRGGRDRPGQDRTPDQRGACGDRGRGGGDPIRRVRRHRTPPRAGHAPQLRPDPHAVLRGVGQPLRRRRVGQRLRTRDRRRVVVEVDPPAAVRGGRGVEHHPRRPRTGRLRRHVVSGSSHGSERSDRHRQFPRSAVPTPAPPHPRESAPLPPRVGAPAQRPPRHTGGSARAPGAPSHLAGCHTPLTPPHPAQQVRRSPHLCGGPSRSSLSPSRGTTTTGSTSGPVAAQSKSNDQG